MDLANLANQLPGAVPDHGRDLRADQEGKTPIDPETGLLQGPHHHAAVLAHVPGLAPHPLDGRHHFGVVGMAPVIHVQGKIVGPQHGRIDPVVGDQRSHVLDSGGALELGRDEQAGLHFIPTLAVQTAIGQNGGSAGASAAHGGNEGSLANGPDLVLIFRPGNHQAGRPHVHVLPDQVIEGRFRTNQEREIEQSRGAAELFGGAQVGRAVLHVQDGEVQAFGLEDLQVSRPVIEGQQDAQGQLSSVNFGFQTGSQQGSSFVFGTLRRAEVRRRQPGAVQGAAGTAPAW